MAQPARMRARVVEVIDHAPGLRSLVLETELRVPRFRPGQFLHLAIDPYDPSQHWPESRCFSLANPPDERRRLRITVSQVGSFTRRVMGLEARDEVWVKLPYGDFVVNPAPGETAVLVAGGTGIAPFASLLAARETVAGPLRLHYGARRPELLVYRDLMEGAAARWPDLRYTLYAEEGACGDVRTGRPDARSILDDVGNAGRACFYLSGPPGMLRDLRAALEDLGVAAERIVVDAWG